MATLLLPCDGSPSALLAVRHAIDEFHRGDARRVHLLNVQPPFSAYVARHVCRELRAQFQRERADAELAEARQLLDAAGVPCFTHREVGDTAQCIAESARRLHCDRVLIGTTRKGALVRAIEHSLTNRLLDCCTVPVEVVAGAPAGMIERIGIPAGVGAGVALVWASAS
ncbi:universal stress protein [Cupriavidus gilardii]|uniref:Universal stress protein n=1 Tax=Cupriavidus gilardii TaxID=82541 RepID=A0ABY4VK71_9BURK|nr:universal stress protein [Cupriavidus gilardii]USE77418.1 universal stress protein [Cupriavidus gilardii]